MLFSGDAAGNYSLLRPDHFANVNGRLVDLNCDKCRPFANRYVRTMREVDHDATIFLEGGLGQRMPRWSAGDCDRVIFDPHWFDMYVWLRKQFDP